jgi:hypothetical protein
MAYLGRGAVTVTRGAERTAETLGGVPLVLVPMSGAKPRAMLPGIEREVPSWAVMAGSPT